ncbi:MAG TPA: response regulator [Sphingomonas sp.]|nr:response regulator [Sphingomonas sp.]
MVVPARMRRADPAPLLRAAQAPAHGFTADRLILATVAGLALASAWLLARTVGDWRFGAGFLAGLVAIGAIGVAAARAFARRAADRSERGIDRAMLAAVLDASFEPAAMTDRSGRLVCANRAYAEHFGAAAIPPALPGLDPQGDALAAAGREAWRDGSAEALLGGGRVRLTVERIGGAEDHLLWRIGEGRGEGRAEAARLIAGGFGDKLGKAGLTAALIDERGRILAANRVFAARATGSAGGTLTGRDFAAYLAQDGGGLLRFARETEETDPLRLIHVPLDDRDAGGAAMMLLFDEPAAEPAGGARVSDIQGLLAMLPLGLALVDRDGRFLFRNAAFDRAAGIGEEERPVYPSDLVEKEDKSAVADAVRRFASSRPGQGPFGNGPILSGDLVVRLRQRPDEPVALTVASASGLGEAAVLLSIKDSSEETRLKRQVAQATKMQAVGQLAGGIAHDFNNILTAVLGHCDLILLRHTPGDSDYDDIQQIRTNANRAAGLTRQLLAFSRQQTLRPQVLQLPDVIAEISNLLRRLLGESMKLTINHGRALGPVRADPGQLEQVIVNLAVNARDAMPRGGTLTIRTYAVTAAEVRRLGADILPIGDYTAVSVTDTGVGIPPDVLPKIFEPFFTTKEVGKGTGLGLSTVYGIVKQSGGFIFADSEIGRGTSFVIYLPVFHGETAADTAAAPPQESAELWGSGSILVVEDEDMVRAVAERALSRQGYTVHTAANGEEALALLAAQPEEGPGYDLLISDVMMPTMDGPTLVRHARRRYPNLPILFMSGYAEEQLRRSIDLDNVSFLPKPFSVQQLAEAARDTLARSRGQTLAPALK